MYHPSWRFSLLFVKHLYGLLWFSWKCRKTHVSFGIMADPSSDVITREHRRVAFGRLLWLNYQYSTTVESWIFGCFSSSWKISSCCVWTNTVFAYFAFAVIFYFFFGQFLPTIISYKVRQAKRAQEGSQNIVTIVKNCSCLKSMMFIVISTNHRVERIKRRNLVSWNLFERSHSNDRKRDLAEAR